MWVIGNTSQSMFLQHEQCTAQCLQVAGGSGTDEERLMIYLENQISPNMRPVKFVNQTVKVGMYVILVDFNLVSLTIHSVIWLVT